VTSILSDPPRTLRIMQVNPWQRLAENWPGVPVDYADLGSPHRHGLTTWEAGQPLRVSLHQQLTQVQRRCALAHELEHLDRGAPCETLRASIERRVIAATARYLLPDLELLAETIGAYDLRRAADELWVTFPVLVDRLRALTDRELEYVTSRRGEAVA
jgi:hypothetical protein